VAVSDREGDVYRQFAHRPAAVDLVVRTGQDRKLADGGRLVTATRDWPELGRMAVEVPAHRPADSARTASLAVRARPVTLKRPGRASAAEPAQVAMTLVELAEPAPPASRTPVVWRLLTTLPVASFEQACEVARIYRLRWRIEQVFRSLKSDGLGLDSVQMHHCERLFKLAALGLPPPRQRCPRHRVPGRRGGNRAALRRRHGAPAKPPPRGLARLALLDHRPTGRLEMLRQATRPQDHVPGLGPPRRPSPRLSHGQSVNPVARRERAARTARSEPGGGAGRAAANRRNGKHGALPLTRRSRSTNRAEFGRVGRSPNGEDACARKCA
jgi:hypothetical protein